MSWRNQGITGSNNIPLGKARRFGGEADGREEDDVSPAPPSNGFSGGPDRDMKRGRSPEPRIDADGSRRRKKRNRWGDASENKAAGLMGLPTAIVANMTSEQLEAYTLHLRIEEISQKLKIDDVVPADGDRSPSPAPQYDNHGRRVNTREYRYRKRLEDERHKLIEKAMKTIPNYHPPQDYRRPTKTQEKVYVPVNDYPEINFIGLLIGPRGNTLKKMETESGAKIAIRGQNELKRNQLRELAALNGTLRDDENQACQNCGQIGHRKYDCPEKQNFTASIICRVCGNAGHMARDCPDRQRGQNWRNDGPARPTAGRIGGGEADADYEQFMAELGGGAAPARIEAGPGSQVNGDAKPWQRGPTGGPAPWRNRNQEREHDGGDRSSGPGGPSGGPAPWARDRRDRHHDNHGNDHHYGGHHQHNNNDGNNNSNGYGGPAPPGAAPWHQAPTAPPGAQPYGGYPGGYPGFSAMGAPPGLGPPPAPPSDNLTALIQQFSGGASVPPPPPPSDSAPPPPPGDLPPPPPPPAA
ncbi:hypothetical protein BD289DRAFT_450098 [Coniella lustricola]|uniref:Branchpoint-bridging protein n=1 Tax=Coniella lustricola TaxID=2025994 RepID=A0A2T3AJJ9_9PEZI|nr:hypothetical protein BD289DRAFT_450098 [Coniella lustricola]